MFVAFDVVCGNSYLKVVLSVQREEKSNKTIWKMNLVLFVAR